MTKNGPLVSVIIPTFNRAAFLPMALASVYAQNIASVQIIVVDDGSTDQTATIVRETMARETSAREFDGTLDYLYQHNCGPVVARNRGLAHAQGEWIAFLDSDDQWVARRLQGQLALAAAYPTAQIIWGMLQVVRQCENDALACQPLGTPTLQTQLGSALIQRALFDATAVGQLDETLYTNDDVDWFCRAFEKGVEIITHQDVVALYRWHGSNLVANQAAPQQQATHGLLHALARSLQRRRQPGNGERAVALQANIRMLEKASAQAMNNAMSTEALKASLAW